MEEVRYKVIDFQNDEHINYFCEMTNDNENFKKSLRRDLFKFHKINSKKHVNLTTNELLKKCKDWYSLFLIINNKIRGFIIYSICEDNCHIRYFVVKNYQTKDYGHNLFQYLKKLCLWNDIIHISILYNEKKQFFYKKLGFKSPRNKLKTIIKMETSMYSLKLQNILLHYIMYNELSSKNFLLVNIL